MTFEYDPEEDSVYVYIDEEAEVKESVETDDGFVLDYDANGKLIGIAILKAKNVISEKILNEFVEDEEDSTEE